MKKIYLVGVSLALVLATTAVFAFGVPKINTGSSVGNTIANKAVDEGKNQVNKAVMDDLNKKLTELTAPCHCNQKTGKITGCKFDQINKEISLRQEGVKTFLNKNFRIKTEVAQACWGHLESKVPDNSTYWSFWNSQWISTDSVSIQVVK